jgi:hypothetical protein
VALALTGGRTYDESVKTMSYKGLVYTLLIGCLAACASTPPGNSAGASVAHAKSAPPGCVDTGSHLASRPADCAGSGRAWTENDIRRTGAIDPAQGLSQLDPSVSISHH